MSRRRIMLLVMAGFIALLTVVVARSMMHGGNVAPPSVQTTEILAVARDLPTGSIIREMDLKWVPWPAETDTSKLYLKGKAEMGVVVGGVLREGLHSGEPLLVGRVVQPHEQGFLAAVLTPGMRAVSVQLTPSGEVAGFIFPGDRVDVILTHRFFAKNDKGENESTERSLSETVVTNARVLALDQKSDSQSTDPKIAQLATLEVSPHQAEKLTLAMDMAGAPNTNHGSLSLVLRSLATEGVETTITDLGREKDETPTMDSDVSSVLPKLTSHHKVHIMRGKDVSDSIFPNQK